MMLCCGWLVFSSSDWCISILAVSCSLGGPLSHGSPVVVLFDRGHPRFWNFYSTIPVDVVRVKSYMNSFFFLAETHQDRKTKRQYQTRHRVQSYCGFALCQRCVRTTSPLPTTTRRTRCFQVGDYAKIPPSTTKRRCQPG